MKRNGGRVVDERVEIVSKGDPKSRGVLMIPIVDVSSPSAFERFWISPDDSSIVAARNAGPGSNAIYLLHRVDGLNYRLTATSPLNVYVSRQCPPPKDVPRIGGRVPAVAYMVPQRWMPDGQNILLACSWDRRKSGMWYLVTLDVRSGRFSDYHPVREHDVSP